MPALKPGPVFTARKVYARLRNRGAGEVLSVARRRSREAIHSSEALIFASRPTGGGPTGAGDGSGLRMKEATPADGELYEAFIGTDSSATFAARLRVGARCFLVLDGAAPLHSSWVNDGPTWTREIRRYFQPPPKDAYVYESFTRAEARGRGVYPFAINGICARLDEEKKHLLWVGVEESNTASRKALAKVRFEEQFRVRYVRKLGFLRVDEPVGPGVRLCFGCLAKSVKFSSQGD